MLISSFYCSYSQMGKVRLSLYKLNKSTLVYSQEEGQGLLRQACCCSVAQSCPTLYDPLDCSTPGFPALHYFPESAQTQLKSIESVMPSNHLILYHPLFPPSIFPSIRLFSRESALHIRWPKYWSFSFSISPSNEYSELISFRID